MDLTAGLSIRKQKARKKGPLNEQDAVKMQAFIQYLKKQAPQLRVVYYDSMTSEGKMDWQNALTDKNTMFLQDQEGNPVADEMFLNFWWTEEELASQDLLAASEKKARELGIDPYDLYAGVDIQADGYTTPIRWDLFESGKDSTHTSLGIYCPTGPILLLRDWMNSIRMKNALWVNNKQDPSAEISYSSPEQWRGVSTYAIEKTAISSLPFVTNFNTGSGYSFFRQG